MVTVPLLLFVCCGFGSQTAYTVRRLRLREELVDLWWAAYHAAMLLVLWALVATAALLGMQLKLQGLEPNWGVGPQSLMLLVYSDSFLHHLVPLADAAACAEIHYGVNTENLRTLTALSALERTVLMAGLEGRTPAQTARELGLPAKNVANALARARRKLRGAPTT